MIKTNVGEMVKYVFSVGKLESFCNDNLLPQLHTSGNGINLCILLQIGQGTYSNVYKARDLETGKVVALKKVRFDNLEPESVRFMAREIQVLRRLDHPNIVKLEGLVTSRMSCSLYLVFEYMEHDLAGLAASPGTKFSEPQVCKTFRIVNSLSLNERSKLA